MSKQSAVRRILAKLVDLLKELFDIIPPLLRAALREGARRPRLAAIILLIIGALAGVFIGKLRFEEGGLLNPMGPPTPYPTYTPLPTNTANPTYTPYATFTPLPTYTPLPTSTPTNTPTQTPTPTPVPPAVIVQQLESQAQLVVVKDDVSKQGFHVGVKDGLCSHGGDFVAQGVIEAGIDFESIDEDSVSYESSTQSYTLQLPAPEITSCRIEYIRLVANSFTTCNPDWDRVRTMAQRQVMSEFVDEVLEDGILKRAELQAEYVIGDVVRNLTGKLVHVTFEEQGASPRVGSSCESDDIGEWYFDEDEDVWKRVES